MNRSKLLKIRDFVKVNSSNKIFQTFLLGLSYFMLIAYIGISYYQINNHSDFWAYRVVLILASVALVVLIVETILVRKGKRYTELKRLNRAVSLLTSFFRILLSVTNVMFILTTYQDKDIFQIAIIILSLIMFLYSIFVYIVHFLLFLIRKDVIKLSI